MRTICGAAVLACFVACGGNNSNGSTLDSGASAGLGGKPPVTGTGGTFTAGSGGLGGSPELAGSGGLGGSPELGGSRGLGGLGGTAMAAGAGFEAGDAGTAGDPASDPVVGCGAEPSDSTALRRLNNWEYQRSVVSLTGSTVAAVLPDDSGVAPPFVFAGSMSSALLEALFSEAERQAATVADTAVSACQNQAPLACGEAFVSSFVSRAFRRPLGVQEAARYRALFDAGLSSADLRLGISVVATEALISPAFLYQIALGEVVQGNVAPLTNYEIASKLAYSLTGAAPDAALNSAAASGTLRSGAERALQAERLLSGPTFSDVARRFHTQWLGLDALSSRVGHGVTQGQADSMRSETLKFIDYVFLSGHSFSSLLTSPIGFVDANLAPMYGVPNAGGGQILFDPKQRAGVLTLLSTLTNHDNPTQRGLFVRERLFCQEIPPPPPGLDLTVTVAPGQTRREAWMQATAAPTCAACHSPIDPLGFGFESYDEIGAFRVTDAGKPVDASGQISGVAGLDGPFSGAIELVSKLSTSPAVYECMARQWIAFLNQRYFDEQVDSCLLASATDALATYGGDILQMLTAIASDPRFAERQALPSVNLEYPPPSIAIGLASQPARRKQLLDFNLQELGQLRQVVPMQEQILVDAHVSAARDLELKLSSISSPLPPP